MDNAALPHPPLKPPLLLIESLPETGQFLALRGLEPENDRATTKQPIAMAKIPRQTLHRACTEEADPAAQVFLGLDVRTTQSPLRAEFQADLSNAVAGNSPHDELYAAEPDPVTDDRSGVAAQQKLRNGEACIRGIQPESINSIQRTQRRIGFDDEIAEKRTLTQTLWFTFRQYPAI